MDTSETYIKMCEKAVEIQEGWKPKSGDIIYGLIDITFVMGFRSTGDGDEDNEYGYYAKGEINLLVPEYGDTDFNETVDINPNDAVWLPRQDQLQEMSGLDWRSFDKKCLVYENPVLVPTKEQAGVRVVMKEKYSKIWTGEDWSGQS